MCDLVVPFGFSVVGQDTEKITFQAGSQEEKASWMDELNTILAKPEALRSGHTRSPSAGVGMCQPASQPASLCIPPSLPPFQHTHTHSSLPRREIQPHQARATTTTRTRLSDKERRVEEAASFL